MLDEPAAALDVQTEHDLYTRFRDLTRGHLTLLISHRFSAVRMADRIVYLADGVVQEEGTHAALLARGGEYARLYRLQAAQYAGQPQGAGVMGQRSAGRAAPREAGRAGGSVQATTGGGVTG